MSELRVPAKAQDPFRAHYRGLILGSFLHVAEAQAEQERGRRLSLRARRIEDAAELLRRAATASPAVEVPEQRPFGPGLLAATRVAWFAALALLGAELAAFGLHSWATGAADLALVALTFAWFVLAAVHPGEPRTAQRTLLH